MSFTWSCPIELQTGPRRSARAWTLGRGAAGQTYTRSLPPVAEAHQPAVTRMLQAFKTYGLMLADNGSAWYVSGAPDARWNDTVLHTPDQVHGSDFEVVDTTGFVNG